MKQVSGSSIAPSRYLQDEMRFQPFLWLLLGVTGIALFLRLYHLDSQSLWLDEVVSLENAITFGNSGLAQLAVVDHIAPLHSILLWLVTLVKAPSEFVMQGRTYSHDGVARLLSRLQVVPDLTNVQLQSSTLSTVGGQNVVDFSIAADIKVTGAPGG